MDGGKRFFLFLSDLLQNGPKALIFNNCGMRNPLLIPVKNRVGKINSFPAKPQTTIRKFIAVNVVSRQALCKLSGRRGTFANFLLYRSMNPCKNSHRPQIQEGCRQAPDLQTNGDPNRQSVLIRHSIRAVSGVDGIHGAAYAREPQAVFLDPFAQRLARNLKRVMCFVP